MASPMVLLPEGKAWLRLPANRQTLSAPDELWHLGLLVLVSILIERVFITYCF